MSYPTREAVQPGQKSYVVASFGRRLGAFLLDGLGIVLVATALGGALGLPGMVTTTTTAEGVTTTSSFTNTGWSALMAGLVSAPYCIGMWWLRGATLAQLALGVRVFRATGPQRLSFGAAALRWALLFGVVSLLGALGGLNYVLAGLAGWGQLVWLIALIVTTARDPMRQGLHDRLAGSLVVPGRRYVGGLSWFLNPFSFQPLALFSRLLAAERRVDGQNQHLGQVEGTPAGALPDVLAAIDGQSQDSGQVAHRPDK
jgi:uncharacterized RDD family membrane protein YckC